MEYQEDQGTHIWIITLGELTDPQPLGSAPIPKSGADLASQDPRAVFHGGHRQRGALLKSAETQVVVYPLVNQPGCAQVITNSGR